MSINQNQNSSRSSSPNRINLILNQSISPTRLSLPIKNQSQNFQSLMSRNLRNSTSSFSNRSNSRQNSTNINNTSPLRFGLTTQPTTVQESIEEQWSIRDSLLKKTLKDINKFSNLNFQLAIIVKMSKTLHKYCNQEDEGSYSLKMIVMQIKSKCEKLIKVENLLHIKSQRLSNFISKMGLEGYEDYIDENAERYLSSIESVDENEKLMQIQELENENMRIKTELEQQLAKLREKENYLKEQEERVMHQQRKYKESHRQKQEQLRQLEGQFNLNQKIYNEYLSQIRSKEQEMNDRDAKLKQFEQDFSKRLIIIKEKEKQLNSQQVELASRQNSSEFERQRQLLDDKLSRLTKKDMEITEKLQLMSDIQKQLQAKESKILEQETNLKEKRNQLFKSYDLLTEKIYDFERECDKLKNKKRQFLISQQKFNAYIQEKFEELEKRQISFIEGKSASKRKSTAKFNDSTILIENDKRQQLVQIFQSMLQQVSKATEKFTEVNNTLFQNNKSYRKKIHNNQEDIKIINEAIDFAFSVGNNKFQLQQFNMSPSLDMKEDNQKIKGLSETEQWLKLEAIDNSMIYQDSQSRLNQLNNVAKFSIQDISRQSEEDNTIDELNKAIIIKAQDLEYGNSIMQDKSSHYQHDSNFDDAGYQGVRIINQSNILDGLSSYQVEDSQQTFLKQGLGSQQVLGYNQTEKRAGANGIIYDNSFGSQLGPQNMNNINNSQAFSLFGGANGANIMNGDSIDDFSKSSKKSKFSKFLNE
ncbi:UNKNOWN [Stylonychia lemnae]|uniref:Uncharacterized protein n=1 Tax=Stylonychia lemnae TaxID=5949 RepID=A0A078ABF6_STYLE|nr:UNKNOWN [Stylonychia lemnae]|eukprot:CDW78118.1 UNKNOWN [Stylonychia lemnae]